LPVQFDRGAKPVIHEMFADLDGYVRGAPFLQLELIADQETRQDFRLERGEPLQGVVRRPKEPEKSQFPRWPPEGPILLRVWGPNLSPRPSNAQLFSTDKEGHFTIYLPKGEFTLVPAMYPKGSKEWNGLRPGQRDLVLELPELKFGSNAAGATIPAKGSPPRIVEAVPKPGETKVSADLREIRVTFDRDMQRGMSWTGGPPIFPPLDETRKARWIDARTCVLPVKLEDGRYYRVGINSKSHRNFRSVGGAPAAPSAIYFTTVGASAAVESRVRVPRIVKLEPANGAADVDPATGELRVTFDVPMGKGMSWTGGGSEFPKSANGTQAHWLSDGKTCVFPVALEPGHTYRLGLNSPDFNNFASEWSVPLEPVVYEFKTR
jgi:RNA polymerase sigma-70 factor (ECF subfamily)